MVRARKREDRAPTPREREREDVLARMLRRAQKGRERRHRLVSAQAGEPLWRTLGRVAYVSAMIVLDGPVLLELVRALEFTALGWALYVLALTLAVPVQVKAYRRWFGVDAGAAA